MTPPSFADPRLRQAFKLHRAQLELPAPVSAAWPDPEPVFVRREVAGRPLFVSDDLADGRTVDRVWRFVRALPFRREGHEYDHTRPDRKHVALPPAEFLEAEPLIVRFHQAVERLFPGERQVFQRSHVNSLVFGDTATPHRDCDEHRDNVTVLYFVNREWERDWGGEIVFYDEADEAVAAVSPRPGRVVLFRGAAVHRVGVPQRQCHMERLTLVYMLQPATAAGDQTINR